MKNPSENPGHLFRDNVVATEIRLVRQNWGCGMTVNDENCLILQQSPNINWIGSSRHSPQRNVEI